MPQPPAAQRVELRPLFGGEQVADGGRGLRTDHDHLHLELGLALGQRLNGLSGRLGADRVAQLGLDFLHLLQNRLRLLVGQLEGRLDLRLLGVGQAEVAGHEFQPSFELLVRRDGGACPSTACMVGLE
ncbi:MAG: hypothetical protein AAB225_15765 [Acidobacteriota bacterium]